MPLYMLRPQDGPTRHRLATPDFWDFRADPSDHGEAEGWAPGFARTHLVGVPGSWNEQLEADGLYDYVGAAWYQCRVFVPAAWAGQRLFLRVGSADYVVTAWVNGVPLGTSTAAFLPFDVDVTAAVTPGETALLVLRVDNRADAHTIPQGIRSEEFAQPGERGAVTEHYPPTRYDFFPYGGLHRPVFFYTTPPVYLHDLRVQTTLPNGQGRVDIEGTVPEATATHRLRAHLDGPSGRQTAEADCVGGTARLTFDCPDVRPWSPADPYLYQLRLEVVQGDAVVDVYTQRVGIREVSVRAGRLLLNGAPIFLRGFGKHEDFPVLGKAFQPAILTKDFSLLRWTNANSFRTSHYPYDEAWYDLADELGVLVIDEVPAVSLNMGKVTPATQQQHLDSLRALIHRDRNHPSVVMWVIANEPGLSGEAAQHDPATIWYWQPLFETVRALDDRPTTVPFHSGGPFAIVAPLCDVVSINRYYGWYTQPGQLEQAAHLLEQELEHLWQTYGKPVLIAEFGVDTVAGLHGIADQMFTEEYQARFTEVYYRVMASKAYCCGSHVWNFADFRAPQNFRRVVDNLKGVFTRARAPKRAAFLLRDLWAEHQEAALKPIEGPV